MLLLRTRRLSPWLYVAPALLISFFFLIYPSFHTFYLSFLDKRSQEFVGLKNYIYAFTNDSMVIAFRNNALWVIFFTTLSISIGLILAVLLDCVRYERIAKSIMFLPMAISMVGAGVIWKFIYAYRPPGVSQIGLLNAIVDFLGGQPVGWLIERPWNNFLIIAVGVWIWTGFCMVVFSAAYKNIIASFAAYAFACMGFPGRDYIFLVVVGVLVLPLQITFIPILRIFKLLHLAGTFPAIWLAHTGYGLPSTVYLLHNFIAGLPSDLFDSASIDGASPMQSFFRIVVPLPCPL